MANTSRASARRCATPVGSPPRFRVCPQCGIAAVMTAPGEPLEVWQLEDPEIEPGSVLLETVASEICGTDVHLHHGRLAGVPYPIVPGHVSVGRVLETGGVERDALEEPLSRSPFSRP